MINYTVANSTEELIQILGLQKDNLKSTLVSEEQLKDGFVTINHNIELLEELNAPYHHIIAKDGPMVVGYALVTPPDKVSCIPLLQSTVDELHDVFYNQNRVLDLKYFIMGQVCIEKTYRGQGIFGGLYREMRKRMKPNFDIIITEISTNNKRSMHAHKKEGFKILKIHQNNGVNWAIVGLLIKD